MVRLLRHRQTKGAETDTPDLTFSAPHPYSTAQDGKRADHTGSLNRARSGRILIQGQVSPRLIIVASVRFQNPAQMCLAQDNDVVHTFTPDRSGHSFDRAMLTLLRRCNRLW